jgi:AraC family transcriptional regulator, alkane utilization regulator
MDALSDVLRVARLSGGVFMRADFTAPWCIAARISPEMCAPFLKRTAHLIPFHYVIEGEFLMTVEGGEPTLLRSGELLLLPHNDVHLMGTDLNLPPVMASDIVLPPDGSGLHSIRHGNGGAVTKLICGYLGCETVQGNPIIPAMPSLIHLKIEEFGPAEWIRSSFLYAASEISAGRIGSDIVLAKLSELLFVEAVRRYVDSVPAGQTGWLAGLQDASVARALGLMHSDIARDWSVDELGREIGLSRSVLAEKFTRLIGMAPIHYLMRWRMQVAAQKLKETNASLAEVAESVGYESEAAFSRAFKKVFGRAPAGWRREGEAG